MKEKKIVTKSRHKSGANSTLIWTDRSRATKFFSHNSQIGYTVLMIWPEILAVPQKPWEN